jgi:hypothetical protein
MGRPKNAVAVAEVTDDEEMSEKDVELLLEQRDREALAAIEVRPLAPLDETSPESALMNARDEHIAAFCAAELPHDLDLAPVHSKIVIVLDDNVPVAVLAGPSGTTPLDSANVASRLPVGARIFKAADDRYEATQLGATELRPMLVTQNAVDAIGKFIAHFHSEDD